MTVRAQASDEPRFVRIGDGLVAQVVERRSPLPQRLDALLERIRVVTRFPMRVLGTRRACTDAEHDFSPWILGVYAGLELRLAMCPFCGTVEVRDISLDILPGVASGRQRPRRRDDVLGWYSGRRPGARQYT